MKGTPSNIKIFEVAAPISLPRLLATVGLRSILVRTIDVSRVPLALTTGTDRDKTSRWWDDGPEDRAYLRSCGVTDASQFTFAYRYPREKSGWRDPLSLREGKSALVYNANALTPIPRARRSEAYVRYRFTNPSDPHGLVTVICRGEDVNASRTLSTLLGNLLQLPYNNQLASWPDD